jgi:hypothetical protein
MIALGHLGSYQSILARNGKKYSQNHEGQNDEEDCKDMILPPSFCKVPASFRLVRVRRTCNDARIKILDAQENSRQGTTPADRIILIWEPADAPSVGGS